MWVIELLVGFVCFEENLMLKLNILCEIDTEKRDVNFFLILRS